MLRVRAVCVATAALLLGIAPALPAAAATTDQYASLIRTINPQVQVHQSDRLAWSVIRNAQRHHIDARLLFAIVTVESHWRAGAVSRHGARGLGQLMPATARSLGVDPTKADQNLSGTSRYLSGLLQRFGSQGENLRLAIGAYNAGPHAVERAGGIPNNGETPLYVRRVVEIWHSLAAKLAARVRRPQHQDTFVVAATVPQRSYDSIIAIEPDRIPGEPERER